LSYLCPRSTRVALFDGRGEDERADKSDDAGGDERNLRRDLPEESADGCRGRNGYAAHEVVEADGARAASPE